MSWWCHLNSLTRHSLQFLKLEDVGEQCRLHQWQIQHRESFLAVMLHHTISHERGTSQQNDSKSEELISDMIAEPSWACTVSLGTHFPHLSPSVSLPLFSLCLSNQSAVHLQAIVMIPKCNILSRCVQVRYYYVMNCQWVYYIVLKHDRSIAESDFKLCFMIMCLCSALQLVRVQWHNKMCYYR